MNKHTASTLAVLGLFTVALLRCGSSDDGDYVPPPGTGGTNADAAADAATTVTVTIAAGSIGQGPAAFGVNPLVIAPGTTVTWVNQDAMPHTATSDTGVWDSGILQTNGTFSFLFAQPGTFPYHCATHGAASMSGTIQVQ